ncbi:MAG: hypothetical protein AAFQ21_15990 [Pseudomonadota bacterium]
MSGITLETLLSALGVDETALRQNLGHVEVPKPNDQSEAEWRAIARDLKRSNDALLQHTEMLACGLGACPACWGADPDCQECGGVGHPGAFLPDERCFRRFVVPVLKRLTETLDPHDDSPTRKETSNEQS